MTSCRASSQPSPGDMESVPPPSGGGYYNQSFVVMEYFGYLRRDPDALYLD